MIAFALALFALSQPPAPPPGQAAPRPAVEAAPELRTVAWRDEPRTRVAAHAVAAPPASELREPFARAPRRAPAPAAAPVQRLREPFGERPRASAPAPTTPVAETLRDPFDAP